MIRAARVVLPAGARREDWLAARRDGIGGSEVGAIFGLSPFATPGDVWDNKVNGATTDESQAMAVGSALEAGVLTLGVSHLRDEYGGDWYPDGDLPALLAHPDHDVIRYSPDGIAHGRTESVLLEAKVTSRLPDEPHHHWVAQVQWGLAVTGLPWGQLTAVAGSRIRHWRIDADESWHVDAIERVLAWWADHVVTGDPPPPVSKADAARWLELREDAPVHRPYTRELADAYAALRHAKGQVAAAQAHYDEVLVRELAASGGATQFDVDGQRVMIRRAIKGRATLDRERLQRDHPRAYRWYYENYLKTPTKYTITATWPQAKKETP